MKKTIAPLFVFIFFLSACYSTKKAEQYINTLKLPGVAKSTPVNNLKITIDEKSFFDSIPDNAQLKKAGRYFVPLPFVAFWKANYICEPGKKTYKDSLIQNVRSSVGTAMEKIIPAENTAQYELILKQDSSNFTFKYNNKGFMIWLLIIQFGSKKEFVSPVKMDMTVGYQLKKDGVVIKTGKVSKNKDITEKIDGATLMPYIDDPMKTGTQNAIASQYQFAQGGTGQVIKNGMMYGLVEYNNMMREVVAEIAADLKTVIK